MNPNAGRELADILLLPEMPGIELRDWKDYDAAVADGYEHACEVFDRAIDRLDAFIVKPTKLGQPGSPSEVERIS